MAELNLRVGASVDRNLQVAFQPLVEGAKRAAAAIEAQGKKGGRAISTETRKGTKDAEERFKELEHEIMTGMPRAMDAGTAAIKEFTKETSASFATAKKNFNDLAREAERSMSKIDRVGKTGPSLGSRAFQAAGGWRGVQAGVATAGRMIVGAGRAGLGAAESVGLSLAHGMGVNTDLGSIFHKNVELESLATALSNKSLIKSDPRNSTRVDPRELMRQALDTSKTTGTDANATLEGLSKFVDLTGDLSTGRDLLKDLEMLAKGTGVSMEDMVAAAGELDLALGNTEGKSTKILHLMRQFSGQAEMGAISMKDLAHNMAKIAASAGQFQGDRANNIAFLGVIGQEARRGGGAATAAQSATAVSAFVNTLKTPKRAAEFEKATGKSVFDKATGMMRDPEVLLREAITAKGMDPLGFKKIFSSVKGAQGPEALATIFRSAGGGAAGEKAVTDELDRLKKAIVDQEQTQMNFQAAMATSESQANVFNNAIRETALKLTDTLIPAALGFAPVLLDMAQKGANVVAWLVGQEAANKAIADKAKAESDSAITNTNQQLAQGFIYEGQKGLNKKAFLDSADSMGRLKGDAWLAHKDRDSLGGQGRRAWTAAQDYINPISWLMNSLGATSGGQRNTAEDETIKQKDAAAKEASDRYEQLKELNQRVADQLTSGVIQVRVTEPIPQGPTPPETPDDGRQPPPEGKQGR